MLDIIIFVQGILFLIAGIVKVAVIREKFGTNAKHPFLFKTVLLILLGLLIILFLFNITIIPNAQLAYDIKKRILLLNVLAVVTLFAR